MRAGAIATLGIGASCAAIVIVLWLWSFFGPAGFTDGKSILARLQGLELEHRHEQVPTPAVFATYHDTGPIIVLRTRDSAFPYAWIAATVPSCDGKLCMVSGSASIEMTCNDLDRLTAHVAIAGTIERMLKKSCRAS